MSKINVKLPEGTHVVHGKQISFRAPCNCSNVTGLLIEGRYYELLNTTQNPITGWDAFKEGVLITVTMDTEYNKAYIQGASAGIIQKSWTKEDMEV